MPVSPSRECPTANVRIDPWHEEWEVDMPESPIKEPPANAHPIDSWQEEWVVDMFGYQAW